MRFCSVSSPGLTTKFVVMDLEIATSVTSPAPLLNDFPDVYFPVALHELNLNELILVLQAMLPVTG